MKTQKRPEKLQTKITNYFIILIAFIIIILDAFFVIKVSTVIERDADIYSYEIVKQLGRNVNSYITHMQEITWIITNQNRYLIEQLKEDVTEPSLVKNDILEQFRSRGSTTSDIVSIFIFGENGVTLADRDNYIIKDYVDFKQMDWYKNAVEAKGAPVISSSHMQNYIKSDGRWVFSVSSAIMDEATDEVLGVVLVDMSYKKLTDMCNAISLGDKGYVYIVNAEKEIIYHPKQQLIYSQIQKEDLSRVLDQKEGSFAENIDEKRFITVHTLDEVGWMLVGVSYVGDLLVSKNEMFMALFAISIICLILSIITARKIAGGISKPIQKLENIMLEVENGYLDVDINIDTDTEEIKNLSHSFKAMLAEIKVLITKIEVNQKKLRKNELQILQAQINPHFLYNSLDTIIWLGEKEEHEKVVDMTSCLAKYFRLSLSKGREVIDIYTEIQHVRHYLLIQKIRYEKKLSFSIDIDPEIYDYMVIKIILQPLVENALYHGIKDQKYGGHIQIRGYKEDQDIILVVEDNGKGMTKEQIDKILTGYIPSSITAGGVAVKNVHQRLQIYFGEAYGLEYQSKVGKWTKVFVRIPAIGEEI